MPSGNRKPIDPELVAYCDRLRAEVGMPDEIMFALLEDMRRTVIRVRAWSKLTREDLQISEEMIA